MYYASVLIDLFRTIMNTNSNINDKNQTKSLLEKQCNYAKLRYDELAANAGVRQTAIVEDYLDWYGAKYLPMYVRLSVEQRKALYSQILESSKSPVQGLSLERVIHSVYLELLQGYNPSLKYDGQTKRHIQAYIDSYEKITNQNDSLRILGLEYTPFILYIRCDFDGFKAFTDLLKESSDQSYAVLVETFNFSTQFIPENKKLQRAILILRNTYEVYAELCRFMSQPEKIPVLRAKNESTLQEMNSWFEQREAAL